MIQIRKAMLKDASLLSILSIASFMPAHGHSSPKKDIEEYVRINFSKENYLKELSKKNHQYYLLKFKGEVVGYSKVIFNESCPEINKQNTTYLSRVYFLEAFYGLGLAKELLDFNKNLCLKNNQSGIWLKVWVENKRAINFYKKMGFTTVGESYFVISDTHSNPNYHMYLAL